MSWLDKAKAIKDKYLAEKKPERIIFYGEYQVIWPAPAGVPGSCWHCAWCGHNESNDNWTDADAGLAATEHARTQHPDEMIDFFHETWDTLAEWSRREERS